MDVAHSHGNGAASWLASPITTATIPPDASRAVANDFKNFTSPHIIIIGSGGNINKLFRLADKKDKKASLLPVESLREIYEALQALPAEQRIKQYKLKPDRADVIVPAAEIFLEVATNVKATGIIVPTIGLSDGIIDSLYTQKMNTPVTPQIQ